MGSGLAGVLRKDALTGELFAVSRQSFQAQQGLQVSKHQKKKKGMVNTPAEINRM